MGLTFISDQAPEIFGISFEGDSMLERFTDRVDPRDRDAFVPSIREATSRDNSWEFEGRFVRSDGKEIRFLGISHPVRKDAGLVYSMMLLDLTQKKRPDNL